VSLAPPIRELKLCYVTDRKSLALTGAEQTRLLLGKMENAAQARVDWIQIREKDLSGRELAALVTEAVRRVPASCRILVNDRLDVAIACGAGGVHLSEQSISLQDAKNLLRATAMRSDFLVGVSAHSIESVVKAAHGGADYVIFGPVYETPLKTKFGAPQGIDQLAKACQSVTIPVIAIGGITAENAAQCTAASAAGIAAIRLFQEAADVAAVVRKLGRE
jgi:thiamine-phosphate pyrophosphorylase